MIAALSLILMTLEPGTIVMPTVECRAARDLLALGQPSVEVMLGTGEPVLATKVECEPVMIFDSLLEVWP